MKEPRGIRNNNFGNIRRSNDKWQGLREKQEDPDFFQFVSPEWGYRALIKTLQNYRRLHGLDSIAEMIGRWAPSHENDTSAYIKAVCQRMHVPATYVPDINDKGTMCGFAAAVSYVENGVDAYMPDVEKGWELL